MATITACASHKCENCSLIYRAITVALVASGSCSIVEADIIVALGEEALAARVCEEGSSSKDSYNRCQTSWYH